MFRRHLVKRLDQQMSVSPPLAILQDVEGQILLYLGLVEGIFGIERRSSLIQDFETSDDNKKDPYLCKRSKIKVETYFFFFFFWSLTSVNTFEKRLTSLFHRQSPSVYNWRSRQYHWVALPVIGELSSASLRFPRRWGLSGELESNCSPSLRLWSQEERASLRIWPGKR